MPVMIASDLLIEHAGHRLRLRGEANLLIAEFESLSALRQFRKGLSATGNRLPPVLHLPGLDEVTVRVRLRNRDIALVDTRDFTATVTLRWWALIATLLRLPARA